MTANPVSSQRTVPEGSASNTDRILIYRVLAELLGSIPDTRTVDALRAAGFAATFSEAGYDLELNELADDRVAAVCELRAEYGRLFLGPNDHLPLFESVQRSEGSGEMWGPSTQLVRRRMHSWGLSPKSRGMVPDHISVELDFVARLADAEDRCRASGDTERADKARRAQRVFIEEHLLSWLPRLRDGVIHRAKLGLYRQLLCFAVVMMEADHLELGAPMVDASGACKCGADAGPPPVATA